MTQTVCMWNPPERRAGQTEGAQGGRTCRVTGTMSKIKEKSQSRRLCPPMGCSDLSQSQSIGGTSCPRSAELASGHAHGSGCARRLTCCMEVTHGSPVNKGSRRGPHIQRPRWLPFWSQWHQRLCRKTQRQLWVLVKSSLRWIERMCLRWSWGSLCRSGREYRISREKSHEYVRCPR